MTKRQKKEVMHYLSSIFMVVLFLIVATNYFYYPKKVEMQRAMTYAKNQASISITDLSDGIHLAEAYPVPDEEGISGEPYRFQVNNYSDHAVKYQIVFENNVEKVKSLGAEALENHYLRYDLQEETGDETQALDNLSEDGVLATLTIASLEEQTFSLHLWLDYNADDGVQNKSFIGAIKIVKVEEGI